MFWNDRSETKIGDTADEKAPLVDHVKEEEEQEAVVSRRVFFALNIRIKPIMFMISFLISLYRQNITYSAPGLIKDLGIDTKLYGTAISSFYLPNALLQLPVSLLAKKIGMHAYCCTFLLLYGITSASMSIVHNLQSLIAIRVVMGVFAAGMNPAFSSYMSDFYGKKQFAKAWAQSFSLGGPVGTLIGGPLAALVLFIATPQENNNPEPLLNPWQWLFLVNAVPYFLLSVISYIALPEDPSKCSGFLNETDDRWLLAKTEATQTEKKKRSNNLAASSNQLSVLKKLLLDPRVLLLASSRFVRTIAVFGLTFFTPLILSGNGKRDMATVALINTIPTIISIGFNQVWAWHSDKTGERILHATAGLMMTAIGLGLLAFSINNGTIWIQIITLTLARVGNNAFMTPMRAFQADIFPKQSSHAGFAVINTVGTLGGIIGPLLVGALRDAYGSFEVPLAFLSGCVVLSTILFLPLTRYKSASEQPSVAED